MKEIIIKNSDEDVRLDKYLRRLLPQAAGGFLYKMLRKKNITLNGGKAKGNEKLKTGDNIRLYFSDETYEKLRGDGVSEEEWTRLEKAGGDIRVLYEDDDIIAVNKPAGLLTQKAHIEDISLNEKLCARLIGQGALTKEGYARFKPSAMNRLDRGTSGIVLCAKTPLGARRLSSAIAEGKVYKEYRCIVYGHFAKSGSIEAYIKKDEKNNTVEVFDSFEEGLTRIETIFEIVGEYENFTELKAVLVTGKSHQIRAQLSHLGNPVVLDRKYGTRSDSQHYFLYPGQLLHAYRVKLWDGTEIVAKCPDIFEKLKRGEIWRPGLPEA